MSEERTYAAVDRPAAPPSGPFEAAWHRLANPFVAVVQAEGSLTTVQLLARMWHDAGLPVAVAGTPGAALPDLVDNTDPEATIIVALSDPQTEPTGLFTPECAVVLADPPDRSSLAPLEHQSEGQFAVLGPQTTITPPGAARMYRVPAPDLERLGDSIALSGAAEKTNAVTAAQAAMLMGVDPFSISRTLATFVG